MMSAQVAVVPSSSARVGPASLKPVSARSTSPAATNSKVAAKLARFRQAPPKPEIQVDKAELKKKLTPLQYRVTQEKLTERPFSGEYLKLNDDGKYCCIVCDAEIFSSETKFDSGCGWPAFYNVIDDKKVIQQVDLSHVGGNLLLLALNQDLARTEVICAKCGAHLGHVFDDGPKPTGKRYCVNSASLKFEKDGSQGGSCEGEQCRRIELVTKCQLASKPAPTPTSNTLNKQNSIEKPKVEPLVAAVVAAPDSALKSKSSVVQTPKSVFLNTLPIAETKTVDSNKTAAVAATLSTRKTTTATVPLAGNGKEESKAASQAAPNTWRVEWRPRIFVGSSKSTSGSIDTQPLPAPAKPSAVEPVAGPSDANNNRIVSSSKYESVKSRYLNHLNSSSKQEVEKHTAKKPSKPLLETHL